MLHKNGVAYKILLISFVISWISRGNTREREGENIEVGYFIFLWSVEHGQESGRLMIVISNNLISGKKSMIYIIEFIYIRQGYGGQEMNYTIVLQNIGNKGTLNNMEQLLCIKKIF